MTESTSAAQALREFIYLDHGRVGSLAVQLGIDAADALEAPDASQASQSPQVHERERVFDRVESALLARGAVLQMDRAFDFASWTADAFSDGQFVSAVGAVRLLDFGWLSMALSGLPAVLKKMSRLEMDALRNSDEGRRMSKSQLQQRSQENQVAISRVEEFKADELGDVVRRLYGNVVRVKIRPNPEAQPNAALVGSAYAEYFYDSPAALTQKYGVEIDAGWTTLGELNIPNPAGPAQPIRTGNQMEDSFEQIALLMNNAFRLANAPAFPALSLTPLAIYRTLKAPGA